MQVQPASGQAFAAFVRANTATLLRTAYLLTGSSSAAEELVQDTLVRLYPKWEKVERADASIAYVRRAMVNGFLNGRRRLVATREFTVDVLPEVWNGSDLAAGVADRDLAWRLLATLPNRQRAALVLRYFHDLDDGQIAEHLACRTATVRSLISRGLARLRAETPEAPEPARSAEPTSQTTPWTTPRRSA
jgi:RNA polymerase sigma-70 factor (sigma-E family)